MTGTTPAAAEILDQAGIHSRHLADTAEVDRLALVRSGSISFSPNRHCSEPRCKADGPAAQFANLAPRCRR